MGTDSGLATSRDNGNSWRFEQGQDYAARVLGLFHPPAGFRSPAAGVLNTLLSGEHITCLKTDSQGNLWIGFWRSGFAVLNLNNGQLYQSADDPRYIKADGTNDSGDYVNAILPLPTGKVLIGRYGGGISVINPQDLNEAAGEQAVAKGAKGNSLNAGKRKAAPAWFKRAIARIAARKLVHPRALPVGVKFPAGAAVPTTAQIVALRDALMKIRSDHAGGNLVIPLNDDWKTRGNWIDHYGRMWSLQYSMTGLDTGGGYDDVCFLRSDAWVNTHWNPKEAARHWLVKGWRNSTDPRTLQDLFHGGRTEANDDDHGETYATTIDGPNLYQTIDLPVGQYVISAYLFNDDAHSGTWNRQRDYLVQLASTPKLTRAITRIGWYEKHHIQPAGIFSRSRPMGISRCENFAGGVYKRFFVRVAPAGVRYRGLEMGCITICIRRNYSLNAICEGLFIDPVGRMPRYVIRFSHGSYTQNQFRFLARKPIPEFRQGEPYIPTDLGFPSPGPHVYLVPPPMPESSYEGGAVMQQLLYLRHAAGRSFVGGCVPAAIVLGRFLVSPSRGGPRPSCYFYRKIPIAIYSPRFFASLLANVPLERLSGHIYPAMPEHSAGDETWFWDKRTADPKITDQQIWPLPKIFKLYHAWWLKKFNNCLDWRKIHGKFE